MSSWPTPFFCRGLLLAGLIAAPLPSPAQTPPQPSPQPLSTQQQCLQAVKAQLDECLKELPPRIVTTGRPSDTEKAMMTTRAQEENACRRQAQQQRTACR